MRPRSCTSRKILRHRRMSSKSGGGSTIAVDEDLVGHAGSYSFIVESQDSLENDDLAGHNDLVLLQPLVSDKAVGRHFCGPAL